MTSGVSRGQADRQARPTGHHPRPSRLRWGGLAIMVVAILAAACTGGSGGGGGAGSGDGTRIVAYQGADVLGGQEVDFNDILRQGKPVVLNFWAGLCPPCRQEMPDFQKVYNEFKGEFILVGLDVGPFVGLGSNNDGRRLLEELGVTYPAAYAKSADLVREYRVLGMPTTVFFTPDGEVFSKKTGFMTEGEMRSRVQALLEASQGVTADGFQ